MKKEGNTLSDNKIPQADFALIGGSGTLSSDFPARLAAPDIKIIADGLVFETPYGKTPPLRLFTVGKKRVLTCKMHGWRHGTSRADASRQIFWTFEQAGIKQIIADGGVGTANHLLDPRDFVIPDDYLDLSCRKDVGLAGKYLLIMREALCPSLRHALIEATRRNFKGRIFTRGIYANTDGRHFESPAEIAMLKGHADIVGQSICPEVYLAREIGACYAGLYYVVNYGEGIKTWSHDTLCDIFYDDAELIGTILLDTIRHFSPEKKECHCAELRKKTLLKGIYDD